MIKYCLRFTLIFLSVLSITVTAFADEAFDLQLSQARSLVEQKSYASALQVYSGISSQLYNDPGLIIEWARVYTYNNQHIEAIKLFEQIRQAYPQEASPILRELADQYRWSGQVFKALEIYKELLKLEPDNTEALLGKAEILSFQDKLEEAYVLYQSVLDKNSGNLNALNAQAKILVWQGYHRQGLSRYEEVLNLDPRNPDALEGMAFAWHWLGNDANALDKLNQLLEFEPSRQAATELYARIKGSGHPFVKKSVSFTNDSTPQTVVAGSWRSGAHLNNLTSIDVFYEHQDLNKKGALVSRLSAHRQGLGLNSVFGSAYEFHVFLYESQYNKVDFHPLTTNTWLTYRPDDYWRFDLAYERETFQDNDALFYKIITDSPSISVDFKPNRFWFFNLKYKRSYFNDDNRQDQIFTKIEYRFSHKPFIKLYYNYYYSGWSEPELDHGYFNPRSLRAHSLGAYTGLEITPRLFFEAKASGGYEFQRQPDNQHKKSDHPTAYIAASFNYRLGRNWLISAFGDFFTTWPDHGQRSYQKRGAYLSLTYNFGAAPLLSGNTTLPYRSTGTD